MDWRAGKLNFRAVVTICVFSLSKIIMNAPRAWFLCFIFCRLGKTAVNSSQLVKLIKVTMHSQKLDGTRNKCGIKWVY